MLGLTPLEQPVAGKELIELGRQKGLRKGLQKNIMKWLTARFGAVSPSIKAQINAITEIARLDQLFSDALTITSRHSSNSSRRWLTNHLETIE